MPRNNRRHSRGRWPDPFYAIGVLAIALNLLVGTGWKPLVAVLMAIWTAGMYIARFAYRHRHTTARSLFTLAGYAALLAALLIFRRSFDEFASFMFFIPALCAYAMPEPAEVAVVGSTLIWLCISYLPVVGVPQVVNTAFGLGTSTILWMMIFRLLLSVETERDRYYRLSVTDSMTGLLTLSRALELGQEMLTQGEAVTLGMIDLDGFKSINDTYGHLAGNHVLTEFSRRLSLIAGQISPRSVVGRLGGDEFVVIFPGDGSTGAPAALVQALGHEVYRPAPQVLPRALPFSLGWVSAPAGSQTTIEELMHEADLGMYANKRRAAAERQTQAEVAAAGPFES